MIVMDKQNSFSNKTIETLKMIIDWIESDSDLVDIHKNKIQACKEALAEAEKQEIGEAEIRQMLKEIEWCHQELAKKEWQSLSDDEIDAIVVKSDSLLAKDIARAIEQALKEKNHG